MTRARAAEVRTAKRDRKLTIGPGRHTLIFGLSQPKLRFP
jgi:hypothetical protein